MERYTVAILREGKTLVEYRLPPPFDVFDDRAEAELVCDWYCSCAVGPARGTVTAIVRSIEFDVADVRETKPFDRDARVGAAPGDEFEPAFA